MIDGYLSSQSSFLWQDLVASLILVFLSELWHSPFPTQRRPSGVTGHQPDTPRPVKCELWKWTHPVLQQQSFSLFLNRLYSVFFIVLCEEGDDLKGVAPTVMNPQRITTRLCVCFIQATAALTCFTENICFKSSKTNPLRSSCPVLMADRQS